MHKLLTKRAVSHQDFPPKLVTGVKIEGDQIVSAQVQMDSEFEKCPIAAAAGIPLFVKRLGVSGRKVENGSCYIIVRMMSEPDIGLAPPRWQYGGIFGPATPVLVARSDGISFTKDDWVVLDDFEMQMLPRKVTRNDFIHFANQYSNRHANVILEALFPKGQRVRLVGLESNTVLNGKPGSITGQYENGRVGVKVDGLENVVTVKPGNLVNISA